MKPRLDEPCFTDDGVLMHEGMTVYIPTKSSATSIRKCKIVDVHMENDSCDDTGKRRVFCTDAKWVGTNFVGFAKRGVFATKNRAIQSRIDRLFKDKLKIDEQMKILESRKE